MISTVNEILNQAKILSSDEQLILAAMLIGEARQQSKPHRQQRKWLDVVGAAPYPLAGEDAQDWVIRNREEGEDRERQWSREK